MKRYSVVQIGLGARGITHLKGFQNHQARIEIAGICDLQPERVEAVGNQFQIPQERWYRSAVEMLEKLQPDILSFCTLPDTRLELVQLAARTGVKAVCMEKPMATSLSEAKEMTEICKEHHIKAVVCHQHKYLKNFQILEKILKSGELGTIERINAECQPWLSQLGTHYMDYAIWANSGIGPVSVVGHVHGKGLRSDSHPSPDYFLGEAVMANGVRSTLQFGYFSKKFHSHAEDYQASVYPIDFWEDDRLTVYGSTGYAWAECSGSWGAFTAATNGSILSGKENGFRDELEHPIGQTKYTEDLIRWLDDDAQIHPCNIQQAFAGYEALEAMCISALEHRRVDLPMKLELGGDINERMRRELPEVLRKKLP